MGHLGARAINVSGTGAGTAVAMKAVESSNRAALVKYISGSCSCKD